MGKKYEAKNGECIKIILEQIRRKINGNIEKKKVKNKYSSGKMTTRDLKNLSIGLDMLSSFINEGFILQRKMLLTGKEDVNRLRKDIVNYRSIMQDLVTRLTVAVTEEYLSQKKCDNLPQYTQIVQAARDGLLLKKQNRIEEVDGKQKEVIYDTSMTPRRGIRYFRKI